MSERQPHIGFNPGAGLLAIVLPGLGHCATGQWKRGSLIFLGVMGLFMGGMLIGGIDVIDRTHDKWWFVLQAGVGPTAFVTDSIHDKWFRGDPARQSIGHVNEIGSLYAGMAGLINLIAIIDAAWPTVRPVRRRGDGVGSAAP